MNKHHGFDQVSWMAFQEAAAEKYDFSTCQRANGSYYGTGGTCRKGSPVDGVPEKEKKGKASGGGGAAEQLRQINAQEGRGGGVGKEGRSPVGKKGIVSDAEKASSSKSGGGATMDKASRSEYGRQAKREQQSAKDIKDEMKRNGKTPELEKKLKQTEARANKFETMSKTGIFQK